LEADMSAKSATWSIQDAKDRFSAMVEAARSRPQTVTKHGKPAVVVMAAEEYDRLRQLERLRAPTFVDHLLSMPRDDGEFERLTAQPRDPGV
jgi:prevent-host-death family protein